MGTAVVSENSGVPAQEEPPGNVVAAQRAPLVSPPVPGQEGSAPSASASETPARPPQPTTTIPIETLSGRFIWISLWRAFRLQISSHEVLRSERKTLIEDAHHIVDPEQQAFLAWRRSVLLLVAIAFVPLTVLRFIEAFQGPPVPAGARAFLLMPAVAEALFCAIAFDQLKNWTKWKKQRRILFIAWALYMFAPFIVYLYPFRSAFDDSFKLARQATETVMPTIRLKRGDYQAGLGLVFAVQALVALGPKVISLMPGLIRASIVSKLLFPGMSAPGWLMILAAPLYALFAYIIVLLPYQVTGSWYFVAGNAGLLVAQIFIVWSGRVFTIPLDTAYAHQRIHRAWLAYILLMSLAAGFLVFGLYEFVTQLELGIIRIFSGVISFVSNVLLLTLICTDAIVGGMAYFRQRVYPDPMREQLLHESEAKLDRFSA
ncbi:MAG: hypothetical protein GY811_16055 [Myxococcales bacterium]|nr:hypothetical protein [Myxococcales bacterium]